jgi:hypothetical protein
MAEIALSLDLTEAERDALSRLLWGQDLTAEDEARIDVLANAVGYPESERSDA